MDVSCLCQVFDLKDTDDKKKRVCFYPNQTLCYLNYIFMKDIFIYIFIFDSVSISSYNIFEVGGQSTHFSIYSWHVEYTVYLDLSVLLLKRNVIGTCSFIHIYTVHHILTLDSPCSCDVSIMMVHYQRIHSHPQFSE
jgi:hypothetical protein